MTEHILTTWLLTYAVHGALFAALAAVAERTCWGAVASRPAPGSQNVGSRYVDRGTNRAQARTVGREAGQGLGFGERYRLSARVRRHNHRDDRAQDDSAHSDLVETEN
jgi:hypothetical protein